MNLNITDRAYDYILKKGGTFIIKPTSVSMGWCGSRKVLWSEASKDIIRKENYIELKYNEVTVFIHDSLNITGDISIDLKSKLPLIGPIYDIRGVEVEYL